MAAQEVPQAGQPWSPAGPWRCTVLDGVWAGFCLELVTLAVWSCEQLDSWGVLHRERSWQLPLGTGTRSPFLWEANRTLWGLVERCQIFLPWSAFSLAQARDRP